MSAPAMRAANDASTANAASAIRASLERAAVKMLERDRMLGIRDPRDTESIGHREAHRYQVLSSHLRNTSWASFFGPASLPPTFECPFDLLKTASVIERWDGGKWLCGLRLLDPRKQGGCNVYSIGSNFDASVRTAPFMASSRVFSCASRPLSENRAPQFETFVQTKVRDWQGGTSCDIHTYDPTLAPPARVKRFATHMLSKIGMHVHLVGVSADAATTPAVPASVSAFKTDTLQFKAQLLGRQVCLVCRPERIRIWRARHKMIGTHITRTLECISP